jgi:small-conductance mechanosensitive channel
MNHILKPASAVVAGCAALADLCRRELQFPGNGCRVRFRPVLFILAALICWPVQAQQPVETKIDQLVRLLDDPEVRTWLDSRHAEAGAKAEVKATSGMAAWESRTRSRIGGAVAAAPRIPEEVGATISRIRADALGHGYAPVLLIMGAILALGIISEAVFLRVRRRRQDAGGLEEFLPVAVLATVMATVFFAFHWPPLGRFVMLCYLSAFVAYRFLATAIRLCVDNPAHRWRAWLFVGISCFAIASSAIGDALAVDPPVTDAISYVFSVVLLLMAMEAVWTNVRRRKTVRTALCLCLVTVWLLWCLDLKGLFWLGVYAFALPPLLRVIGAGIAARVSSDEPGSWRTILLVRGGRALVLAAAVAWLAVVWHVNTDSLARQNLAMTAVLYGLLKSVIVLLLADLVWHLAKAAIDRRMTPSSTDAHAGPAQTARATRLHTLLPIFRNILAVVVAVIAGLIVLAELGVEIGPLIAGAGIFGVALGFGSQTLVKDVISGVFYMLDDAFRVGEYIQAKSYKGTVEGFSLRSVRLRHHRGPVYTVPFGELGAVENMSRDWAVVKFIISVGYDTDVAKVKSLTKMVGKEIGKDEEFEPFIIEPLKMKGVEKFGEYGIDLSFGMTLRPGPLQSAIRRRAYAMIREAFRENGIQFAQPMVQVGGDEKGEAAAASAVLRAQQVKAVGGETGSS